MKQTDEIDEPSSVQMETEKNLNGKEEVKDDDTHASANRLRKETLFGLKVLRRDDVDRNRNS